jgi:cellulose synthase/poly-beta-1,6-N-acetylglucosamine synthase-like glycosyltransferase
VQAFVRYGQTWKYTNVSYIVPGALSIYKTSVLRKIHIDAPHLIIEDFNMTFELQKKRLGKIAYAPHIKGYHQDPYTFGDYVKQMRRWYLGFWQTVYRNGIWPSFFWISTGEIIIQLLLYSLFIVSIPISFFALFAASYFTDPHVMSILISKVLFEIGLLLVIDYVSTVITAIYLKKPALLIFGLGFFVLLFVDSLLYLATLPLTFASRAKVTGVWVSPKRKLAI